MPYTAAAVVVSWPSRTAHACNRGRPGPLSLTLVGLVVSFLPGLTRVEPPSELILAALEELDLDWAAVEARRERH